MLGHPLVEVRQHFRPSLFVPSLRLFIGKPRVREPEQRAAGIRRQFDSHHSLHAFSCRRDPSQFDKSVTIQAKEPTVVRVPCAFKVGLEKEDGVDFTFHQDRTRNSKPSIKLLRPRTE